MTHVFTKAALKIADGTFGNLAEAGADLRVALLMSGNNCLAARSTAEFVGDLTLDEFDGGGSYARQALASQVLTLDAANHRVELTASANVWTSLPPGTDDVAGVLIFKFVTNDADSPVLAYIDDGGFPKPATGSNFTITWSADGLLQLTCPAS